MAVIFVDPGGEYYFSSGVNAPGIWSSPSGASLVNNAPAGALTTYAIQLVNGLVDRILASSYVTLIVGGRCYVPSGFTNNQTVFGVFDGATAQAELRVDATGHLFIARNGTLVGSASSNALVSNSGWHYIELIITIGPASAGTPNGSAEVWVDNVQWLVLSGVNTKNSSNQSVNKVRFGATSNGTSYWKDIYIVETTGGVITTRRGDRQVQVIYPNAAGVNQQFSNTGGVSQTASVQDGRSHSGTWPDGDTSYISDSVSPHISDFAHDALSAGSIDAVVHASYLRSDVGTAGIVQVALSGAAMRSAPALAIGNTYNYFFDVMEIDPNTGAAWTVANFNSATFGVLIPGQPDEDFWLNEVPPVAAKHYVYLPLGDPDEIIG